MKTHLIAALLVATTLAPALAQAIEDDKIDLVSGGYVCDRKDQVCYDQRGASVAMTRQKFGEYAARDVQKKLDKKGDWGTKKFTLSNGVKCNVQNRVCKKEQGEGDRAKKITSHLFGGR
ncbi:MAG TPA: YcgJ family protein [Steroidobacteraceae bacterium]